MHDADLYAEEGGGLGVELAANAPKNADDKPVLSRIATSPAEEHGSSPRTSERLLKQAQTPAGCRSRVGLRGS
ncbi:hypothetical protein [Streptomyces sp. NBC_00063]|uniref:hypothetical protein n=1 Tax=Streptomyces sp. NBC_00063 TaxID=2975638 RepID=UPI003D73203C